MPRAVIFTALPVEYLAVRSHLIDLQEEMHPQGTIYERGKFASNGQVWEVGIVETGAGNAGAAVEAERAIAHFNPSVILFVGVAGGIKDVAIGDVVAATKVYSYESGKAKQKFQLRPDLGLSTYSLIQRARAESKKSDWLQRLTSAAPDSNPRVFVAPIAAGEKVIASSKSDVFKFIQLNYGDAVAVEMEGRGLLQAAHANHQVSALVVRGISDLIDGKSEADAVGSQEMAAHNASAFAFEILAKVAPINIITGSSNAQSQSHLTAEVSEILGGGIDLEAAIASAYQSALPTDASLHPVQANDKISELADRRVLHKFIEILANDRTVSESTRAELQKIISTPDPKTNSDRADTTSKKRLRSYLIVVLRPEPNLKFCVNAWLIPDDSVKGSSRFSSLDINEEKKGVVCSLSDISGVVTELLDHSLEYMMGKDYDLTIEFFLPIDALSTELDRLEIADFLESYPLGKEFKVLVRSYERLENNYLSRYLPQWRSNWDRATSNFQTVPILDSFKPFSTINNCNWKKLAVDLKEKIGIKITCVVPELEQKSLFKAILISAIPIAVWMRKDIRECDRESKLDCLLTSGNLETLPEYIRKEREEAYICDDPEEHFGNHLVLLWEDPNRLTPDVMARLLPTGQ